MGELFNSHNDRAISAVELETYAYLPSSDAEFQSASFDIGAELVVTGSAGGRVQLWTIPAARLLHEFTVADSEIWLVRISHNGEYLLFKTSSGFQGVWSTRLEKVVCQVTEPCGCDAAFLPCDNSIVSGGIEGPIRSWCIADGKESQVLAPMQQGKDFDSCTFSRWNSLAFAQEPSGDSHIFDLERKQRIAFLGKLPSCQAAFSADGTQLATCLDEGPTKIWEARTGQLLAIVDETGIATSHMETSVALCGRLLALFSCATPLMFWDTIGHKPIHTRCCKDIGYSFEGEFSLDGRLLLLASDPSSNDSNGTTIWRLGTKLGE
jgi:WD40 repeat protein